MFAQRPRKLDDGLEAIDVRELSLMPQSGAQAYRYYRQPAAVKVEARKYAIQEVVETVVMPLGAVGLLAITVKGVAAQASSSGATAELARLKVVVYSLRPPPLPDILEHIANTIRKDIAR